MAFLRPSVTFTRYHIVDEIPHNFWTQFSNLLNQFIFREIDNTAEERSYGWVSFDDILDTEWTLGYQKAEYITFALRIDTRRIPPAIYKKYYSLKIKEEDAAMLLQGKKFITKERKIEIKEQVRLFLFTKILPLPSYFQIVWSLHKNMLYFGSTQTKIVHLFAEYFMQSFSIQILPLAPLDLAYSLIPEQRHTIIDTLESSTFGIEERAYGK
ncbi:MAG: hypothetical protein ACRCV3_02395 [Desulfovibrionaceae bacterium]